MTLSVSAPWSRSLIRHEYLPARPFRPLRAGKRVRMMAEIAEHGNFVGGEWVASCTGQTMDVINPATEAVIARVPRGSEAQHLARASRRRHLLAGSTRRHATAGNCSASSRTGWKLTRTARGDRVAERGKPHSVAQAEIPSLVDNLRFIARQPANGRSRHRRIPRRLHVDGPA